MGKTLSEERRNLAFGRLSVTTHYPSFFFLCSQSLAGVTDFLYLNMIVNKRAGHQARNQGAVLFRARVKIFLVQCSLLSMVNVDLH